MRFAIIIFFTKLSILTAPQIFSGDIPFQDISCWSSLRSNVVKYGKRPAKPQPQDDVGRELDDNLWSLIEECWSQEPSNRPTAKTVSLRLGGVNGCLVNPAEMYKKEIAAFTEELARVKERSKAAIHDLETELARRDLEQVELKTELTRRVLEQAELKIELGRSELEKAELKQDLDEERRLRKQVERNADEKIKSVRQDLETELAKLRDTLAKRELEQAGHISILRSDGPGLSPNEPMAVVQRPLIPDGKYAIKNQANPDKNYYWNSGGLDPIQKVYFWSGGGYQAKRDKNLQVNNHSPIIQVIKG